VPRPDRRPPGRRPGPTQTRESILAAALTKFVEDGYVATTIRAIATAAGVDQALVLHYFGSKDRLFAAALRTTAPTEHLLPLFDEGPADLGVRLADRYLLLWEQPPTADRIAAILRAASTSPSAASMVSDFVIDAVMRPLACALGSPDADLRASLASSHLFGTAIARYLIKVPPLASLHRSALVAVLGPVIQHYLTGELTDLELDASSQSCDPGNR
jgi:AcrR family transcriptional regulator